MYMYVFHGTPFFEELLMKSKWCINPTIFSKTRCQVGKMCRCICLKYMHKFYSLDIPYPTTLVIIHILSARFYQQTVIIVCI